MRNLSLLAVLLAPAADAQQVEWTTIAGYGSASDVDGSGQQVILRDGIWSAETGIVTALPDASGATTLEHCDSSGTVIAGNGTAGCLSCNIAARYADGVWSIIDPAQAGCGGDESWALGLSRDGTTVVGLYWDGCTPRPYHWSLTGGLTTLVDGGVLGCRALCANANGSVVGGWDDVDGSGGSPAVWTDLSLPPTVLGVDGAVFGSSADGAVLCGEESSTAAIFRTGQPVQHVPPAGVGGSGSRLIDCDAAGETFVGHFGSGIDWTPIYHRADVGTIAIPDLAGALGVVATDLDRAQYGAAVSDDGRVLVGTLQATSPFASQEAWILALPAALLFRDVATLSVGAGGMQTLEVLGGPKHAGDAYLVLGSASGTSPGFTSGGVSIPLNPDAYFAYTLASPNSIIASSFGTLDGTGKGTAALTIPAGANPALAGLAISHAAVVIDLQGPSVAAASNPQGLLLVP